MLLNNRPRSRRTCPPPTTGLCDTVPGPQPKGLLIGYARVSTDDQRLDLQRDALLAHGVDPEYLFEEKISGVKSKRPQLETCLKILRRGDVLVVWRLDRLGRSIRELVTIAHDLAEKGVELRSLTEEDFVRILSETRANLVSQYKALLGTEKLDVDMTDDAIAEVARIAAQVNEGVENIGARRLQTVMEKLFEELSFEAEEMAGQSVTVDAGYVRDKLSDLASDTDLSKFIL